MFSWLMARRRGHPRRVRLSTLGWCRFTLLVATQIGHFPGSGPAAWWLGDCRVGTVLFAGRKFCRGAAGRVVSAGVVSLRAVRV